MTDWDYCVDKLQKYADEAHISFNEVYNADLYYLTDFFSEAEIEHIVKLREDMKCIRLRMRTFLEEE